MRSWSRRSALVGLALLMLATVAVPAPAQDNVSAATIAARQKFFGSENVDAETGAVPRGEVHLSWVSTATFAVAMDGHVLLFDAYIHKEESQPNYVPAVGQDLVDLDPEYIIVGHGHFDHALDAGPIAVATGAINVGTQSHCDQAEELGGAAVECIVLFDGANQFGDQVDLALWDGVCSTAILHPHSAAEPPDPDHDPTHTVVPVPDAGNVLIHPPGFTLDTTGDEGGTVLYQFRIGNFSLTYHDSTGPAKEQAPGLFDVLEALPNTDVEVGAILGFNQITNGLRDPAMYAAAISPQVYVPNHHDFVTEYGSADDFEPVLLAEFEDYGADPELRFLYDPYDYVRPNLLSFDVNDERWVEEGDEICALAASDENPDGIDGGKGPLATTGGSATPALLVLGCALAAAWLRGRRSPGRT